MNKSDIKIPDPQQVSSNIAIERPNIETDIFVYSIDGHNFRNIGLSETDYLTPELQSLTTENMNNILYNIQTIIHELNRAHTDKLEKNYKLSQCHLKKIIEQSNKKLQKAKEAIDQMQQNITIYKNEIKKLILLLDARNSLIEQLIRDNQELQKQKNSQGSSQISDKILF